MVYSQILDCKGNSSFWEKGKPRWLAGAFLFSISIIAGWWELIGQANVLDWRGFCGFGA
jgi:hypothetical protein